MRALALVPFLVLSCAADENGLVLAMSTDMIVPADIDSVGVYLQHLEPDGRVRKQWSFEVAPIFDGSKYVVRFPATLSVESRRVDGDKLRARVVAFQGGSAQRLPVVMREARTQVPTDRQALLRLPLLWLNAGTVTDNGSGDDPFGRYQTNCPAEQTRGDDGECESIDVPLADLPSVGAQEPLACFDVAAVFGDGGNLTRIQAAAIGNCTVPIEGAYDPDRTQVGLVTASGYDIGNDERVRPLPRDAFVPNGTSVTLKAAACASLANAVAVLVSQRSKGPAPETACAPWLVEERSPVEVEPATPGTPIADASVVSDAASEADADAATERIVNIDPGAPGWDFGAGVKGIALGAEAIYVAKDDGNAGGNQLRRYDREPEGGAPRTSELTNPGSLFTLGTVGARDALFHVMSPPSPALQRITYPTDGGAFELAPVQLCVDLRGCVNPFTEATPNLQRPVRDQNGRLYFAVEADGVATLYSTSSGTPSGGETTFVGTFAAAPSYMFPAASGGVELRIDGRRATCVDATCTVGVPSDISTDLATSPAQTGGLALSLLSSQIRTDLFALGSWNTASGPIRGVVHIADDQITMVRPVEGAVDRIVGRTDAVCWASATQLRCMRPLGPARDGTVHRIVGIVVDGELFADETYVYWSNAARSELRRRPWADLVP